MRSEITDAIDLVKSGEAGALEKAVTILQQAVFAFSMKVCGQRQDAEDTMQEVLVKAMPHLRNFDNSGALVKWLYKVAKNHCLMSRRKSKFAPSHELSLDELMPDRQELERLDGAPAISPETSAIHREQAQGLREAIRTLPPHYRIILVLRDMEGFTDEEVGEITGLQPNTVRVRLHRARLFMRRELVKRREAQDHPARDRTKASATRSASGRCRKMFAGLSDYLDGQLDDFSCEEIETHLDGCEPCKKVLHALQATIQTCRHFPTECPDPQKTAQVRKQLLAVYSRALAAGK